MTTEQHKYMRIGRKGREYRFGMAYIRGWTSYAAHEIEGSNLIWKNATYARQINLTRKVMQEILSTFIKLENAPDEKILRFAREWGVLGICEHGLPSTHILRPAFENGIGYVYCKPQQRADGFFYEPLEMWRETAKRIKSLINLIDDLYKGRKGDPNDWRQFSDWLECPTQADTLMYEGYELSLVINRMLEIADVRPQFWWADNKLIFTLAHSSKAEASLFAALITWVALSRNFPDRFTTCSACGNAFQLREGQSIWRKNYCENCGVKVVWQEASKRYREKNRENPSREKRKVSRLTEEQVRAIRQEIKSRKGKESIWLRSDLIERLAKEYDVSESTIYKIAEGKTWKHVK